MTYSHDGEMSTRLMRTTGEALYGPRWQRDLARDLCMSERHMRRLAAGTAAVTPGMLVDLWRVCEERAALLDELIERLKAGASTPGGDGA